MLADIVIRYNKYVLNMLTLSDSATASSQVLRGRQVIFTITVPFAGVNFNFNINLIQSIRFVLSGKSKANRVGNQGPDNLVDLNGVDVKITVMQRGDSQNSI